MIEVETKKTKNVQFGKKKNGDTTHTVVLPTKWLRDMGVTEHEKGVTLEYKSSEKKGKRIIITKKE